MLQLFRNKNYFLYWLSQSVSGLGNWINFVGLNLYVYKTFGSGNVLGIFLVIRMLPSVLFGSVGGYLADRFDKRRIMIFCDVFRALLVLSFLWTKSLYAFYMLGLLLSIFDKIFLSARASFVPHIVEKDKILSANSLNEMTSSIITIMGPALGGVLLTIFPYRTVFIVDSATFAFSVLCLLFIRYAALIETEKRQSRGIVREFVDEYRDAFSFLSAHHVLLLLLLLRFADALGSGAYNVALPIYSRDFTSIPLFGAAISMQKGAAYGWLVGIWAVGQFLGSLLTRQILKSKKASNEDIFSISIVIMALGMGAVFHCRHLALGLAAIFLGGIGDGVSSVIFITMLMKESPDKMRGKLMGSLISLILSASALGMLAAGWLSDKIALKHITDGASILILAGVIVGRIIFFQSMKSKAKAGIEESVPRN